MPAAFAPTEECDASEAYKEAYIHASEENIEIIQSPVGMPGRALRNKFIDRVKRAKLPVSKCYNCLEKCSPQKVPYCITKALIDAVRGDVENGSGVIKIWSKIFKPTIKTGRNTHLLI